MIYFKIDVTEELKKKGFTSTKILREKLLPSQTLQNIRAGKTNITIDTLNRLCLMLRMEPEDIIGYKPTDEEKIKFF